jgi:hypothetical protein
MKAFSLKAYFLPIRCASVRKKSSQSDSGADTPLLASPDMDALKEYLDRHRSPETIRLERAVLLRLLDAKELELRAAVEAEAARQMAKEAGVARAEA